MADVARTPSPSTTRLAFLETLDWFRDLAAAPAVGRAWGEPSCLAEYTVGGLVGHVLSATGALERYLDAAPAPGEPIANGAYYADVAHPADAPERHRDIRARGEAAAERGQAVVVDELDALRARLRERLVREPDDRTLEVMAARVLRLDDYLETRILEIVVHGDDVAASVGLAVEAPAAGMAIAVEHLLTVARVRHGDLAVLRAFARRERDDVNASRVL